MITTEQMQEAIQGLTFVLLADTEPREWTRDDLVNAGLIYSHIALRFAIKTHSDVGCGERTKEFASKLRDLPPLMSTAICETAQSTKIAGNWFNKGGKDRQKNRAKTFPGIAKAMAEQWG